MKNFIAIITFNLLVLLLTGFTNAQSLYHKEGNVKALIGVTNINIIYDYSKTQVGNYKTEEEYFEHRREKNPGKIDKIKQGWYDARFQLYEPKFEQMLNKYGEKINMQGSNYADKAKVTLKVVTTMTEPGFNVGVVSKPAYINADLIFTDQDGKVIALYKADYITGSQAFGYDFDVGTRVSESYAKMAKMLMKLIKHELKNLN